MDIVIKSSHLPRMVAKFAYEPALNCVHVRDKAWRETVNTQHLLATMTPTLPQVALPLNSDYV
jgi:hypothetical protein